MALKPRPRLSNIEALRLLALALIVGVHVSSWGVVNLTGGSANWLVASLINTYSRFGVDLFVLIGAFFMSSTMLNVRGITKRWWRMAYPLGVLTIVLFLLSPPWTVEEVGQFIIEILVGTGNVSWHNLWLGQLWFVFPYMLLIAVSPVLNHAVRSMSREEHKAAILVLTAIFIGIPTINALAATDIFFAISDTSTNLASFIALYFVAAYIRKYDVTIAPLRGVGISLFLGIIAFALVIIYSLLFAPSSPYPSGAIDYLQGNNTILIYAGAIFLFLAFRSMSFQNGAVSFVGRLTYEAFLIHSVVYFYLLTYWPSPSASTLPPLEYALILVLSITLITIISLSYGLGRFFMDWGLSRLIERSGLGNIGRWIVDKLF